MTRLGLPVSRMAVSRAGRMSAMSADSTWLPSRSSRLPSSKSSNTNRQGVCPRGPSGWTRWRRRTARGAWSLSSSLVASICWSRVGKVTLVVSSRNLMRSTRPYQTARWWVGMRSSSREARLLLPRPPIPCRTTAWAPPLPSGCLSVRRQRWITRRRPTKVAREATRDSWVCGSRNSWSAGRVWMRARPLVLRGVTMGASGDLSA